MQMILVLLYQLKRMTANLSDLNIMFELVSLIQLIYTEEKLSLHQVIFNQWFKVHEGGQTIHKQIYLIRKVFLVACAILVVFQIGGVIKRWLIFRMYTHVQFGNGVDDFEDYLKWYTILVISTELAMIAAYVLVVILFFYKAYSFNK